MDGPRSRCSICATPLPAGLREEFCPVCLLRDAATPEPGEYLPATLRYVGDYELLGEIARGGMGVVFRARQVSLGRTVALKLMLGGHFAHPDARARFRAEAAAAARLQHPHLVTIHEIGEHDGQPYFSMDYVEGGTLADLVRTRPLPARRAATYLHTLAQAVAYAHSQGVLHRDLKPSNVLIDCFDQPRITDFGLAKSLSAAAGEVDLTMTGTVLGSPAYAAPEQARGDRTSGAPADVYSLGALLYHLLTGRPPFQGEHLAAVLQQVQQAEPLAPRTLNPSVPADLETVCLKCLEKDPERRYASALALAEDLRRFLAGEPVHARPVGWSGRLWRWGRRHPAVASLGSLAVVLLLVVAVGASVAAVRIRGAQRETQRALRQSLLEQARAVRLSLENGQRHGAQAAVRRAVALGLEASDRFRARSEWLAGLAETDVEFVPLPGLPPGADATEFRTDATLESCARLAPDQHVEIRELPSGQVTARWPVPGALRVVEFTGPKGLVVTRHADGWQWREATDGRLRWTTNAPALLWTLDPSGRQLACTGNGQALDLVQFTSDPPEVRRLSLDPPPGIPPECLVLRFSRDGGRLAVGRRFTNQVDILEVASGKRMTRLTVIEQAVALEFGPDPDRLLATTSDGRALIYGVHTGTRLMSFLGPAAIRELTIDPAGRRFVSVGQDQVIRVQDQVASRLLVQIRATADRVHFRADGRTFGLVSRGGKLGWLQVTEATGFVEGLSGNLGSSITELAFSPDSRWVAGRYRLGARVMSVADGQLQKQLEVDYPTALAWRDQSPGLLVVSRGVVHGWETATRPDGTFQIGARLAWRPEPDWLELARAARSGGLALKRTNSPDIHLLSSNGVPQGTLPVGGLEVDQLQLSPSGRWLAGGIRSVGFQGVRLWEPAVGSGGRDFPVVGDFQFALSPDDQWLAISGATLELRRTADGTLGPGWTLPEGRPLLGSVAFSPDGRWAAVVVDVYDLHLVSVMTGHTIAVLEGPSPLRINQVAFSPDGRHLAAATVQGKIRLWDLPRLRTELRALGMDWSDDAAGK
jgi:WD40 repeat protein